MIRQLPGAKKLIRWVSRSGRLSRTALTLRSAVDWGRPLAESDNLDEPRINDLRCTELEVHIS